MQKPDDLPDLRKTVLNDASATLRNCCSSLLTGFSYLLWEEELVNLFVLGS